MTSLELKVDADLLERMLDWASDIEDFERHHAVDGLFNAKCFSVPPLSGDEEDFFFLALDIAFWYWVDDRSDKHLMDQTNAVNWDRLIGLAEGVLQLSESTLTFDHEEVYFSRLSNALEDRSSIKADHNYWLQTFSRVARGMHFEEKTNKIGRTPSYIECLEYGIGFSAIPNIIATTALLHGVSRADRQKDMILPDLERCFCMEQRMLNDLHSAEKERRESKYGKNTNVILLLEKLLGPERAKEFVEYEISSLKRMIESMSSRLGWHDPFVRLIHHAMKNIDIWYKSRPIRYQT